MIILTQPLCSLYTYSTFNKTLSLMSCLEKKIISYYNLTPNWDCITIVLSYYVHYIITALQFIWFLAQPSEQNLKSLVYLLQDLHNHLNSKTTWYWNTEPKLRYSVNSVRFGPPLQKRRPHKLLWMLWFDEKNMSNVLMYMVVHDIHM